MTSGKSSSNQRSDNTQTFELEDRNYYVYIGAIYNKEELDFLFECGVIPETVHKNLISYPAPTCHWWMDLKKKGYKMFAVHMQRDGTVLRTKELPKITLFSKKRLPWTFIYQGDSIIAQSLSKDEAQAIAYADKKRIENFLNPKWLALINDKHNEIEVSF